MTNEVSSRQFVDTNANLLNTRNGFKELKKKAKEESLFALQEFCAYDNASLSSISFNYDKFLEN